MSTPTATNDNQKPGAIKAQGSSAVTTTAASNKVNGQGQRRPISRNSTTTASIQTVRCAGQTPTRHPGVERGAQQATHTGRHRGRPPSHEAWETSPEPTHQATEHRAHHGHVQSGDRRQMSRAGGAQGIPVKNAQRTLLTNGQPADQARHPDIGHMRLDAGPARRAPAFHPAGRPPTCRLDQKGRRRLGVQLTDHSNALLPQPQLQVKAPRVALARQWSNHHRPTPDIARHGLAHVQGQAQTDASGRGGIGGDPGHGPQRAGLPLTHRP